MYHIRDTVWCLCWVCCLGGGGLCLSGVGRWQWLLWVVYVGGLELLLSQVFDCHCLVWCVDLLGMGVSILGWQCLPTALGIASCLLLCGWCYDCLICVS